MSWDDEDADKRAKHRDRAVRSYVGRELARLSPAVGAKFRDAGIDRARIRSFTDVRRAPATSWDEVADDPAAFVLQPREADLLRVGDRRLVAGWLRARVTRNTDAFNRTVVEPRYKPVVWLLVDGVPVGYTDEDLDRLGEAGARVLSVAGLDRDDVLVSVVGPGPHLAHWQVELGARHAGIAAVHLGPDAAPEAVAAAAPSALVGSPAELLAALEAAVAGGVELPGLETVLVAGADPSASVRERLANALADVGAAEAVVMGAWAPRGARALWAECPTGPGYHAYPDFEVVEVVRGGAVHADGEGELLWSALGWRGTALWRLRTGAEVEVVDERCEGCGRTGPIVITRSAEALVPVWLLETVDEITSFHVEWRRDNGADELLVFLSLTRGADLDDLLVDVDRALHATQYVVLPKRAVDAKVAAAGARVVDER